MIPKNSAGVNVSRVCLLAALLMSTVSTAKAITITDKLDSWKLTASHTDGLTVDDTNPDLFYSDLARVKNQDGSLVGSFSYHYIGIRSFAAYIYYFYKLGTLEVYASPDNVTWSPVTVSHTPLQPTVQTTESNWTSTRISADLPPGTDYIAFTLHAGINGNYWTPEVGQIVIDAAKDPSAPPGPAGLTVVAAGGQASLAWFPIKGADSYTVMRRPASSKEFQTVEAGVTSTSYTDIGLRNGAKYYYAVTANVPEGVTDESDEVLAVPDAASVVLTDPFSDWNLTTAHSDNMEFDKIFGGVACVRRTDNTRQTFEYSLPGASSFSVNVFSADADMNDDLTVESSADGTNWSTVSTSLKLSAKPAPGLFAAVCSPTGKLPPKTNFLRFALGVDGAPAVNPSLGQLRITYGATDTVKKVAAHSASRAVSPASASGP